MHNQAEAYHNRLLRRADWRFLLENPWPEISMCFNNGLLAQAVQAVSPRLISPEEGLSAECDLVVATNPNKSTLHKAWQALRSGGSFYSEWYYPFTGGSLGIHKRMEAAGFTNVVCYWPWPIPTFSPALFWLPLEAQKSVQYFLSTRSRPVNQLMRFGSSLMQFLWRFLRNSHLLIPICVTACKVDKTAGTTSTIDPEVETSVIWSDKTTTGSPTRLDIIMWTGGKRSINKVILYLFAAGEAIPQRIVKLPRTPEAVPALIHEAHILQALHARKSEAATGAPSVLFLREINGWVALGETTVFGQPLYSVLNSQNAQSLAMKVTDWLASLVVDGPGAPRADWWVRLVEPALNDFELAFGPVLDDFVVPKCRKILDHLGDLPQAFEHRDCSPWNLLVTSSGGLAVLDWESAEQNGLPAMDLIYFLVYLAFFMDGAMNNENFIESYRRACNPTTLTGRLQAACQQRYIESIGLDPAALLPLRLLTWLIHSRSEVRHMSADEGGSPQLATLHRSLFYRLVLEELAQETTRVNAGIR